MLIIQDYSFQIAIPSNEAYAIYSNDYYADKEGNILTEIDSLSNVYEYGDIIIQTSSTKYILKKVYTAYDYVSEIIRYIEKHRDDDVIFIDLYELDGRWEVQDAELEIEVLR